MVKRPADVENEVWTPEPWAPRVAVTAVTAAPRVALVEHEDIAEMMKSNIPAVARRAMELALETEKPGECLAMLQVMLDRAYGKAVQQIQADVRSVQHTKIEVRFV